MPRLGDKKGPDGKFHTPKETTMEKEQTFHAPHIHKGVAEPTKKYYFENRKQEGQDLNFFAGNAPVKGMGKREGDMRVYNLKHGSEVELTESMARHVRGKGMVKPVMDVDDEGRSRPSGRTYTDRLYDLHEV